MQLRLTLPHLHISAFTNKFFIYKGNIYPATCKGSYGVMNIPLTDMKKPSMWCQLMQASGHRCGSVAHIYGDSYYSYVSLYWFSVYHRVFIKSYFPFGWVYYFRISSAILYLLFDAVCHHVLDCWWCIKMFDVSYKYNDTKMILIKTL